MLEFLGLLVKGWSFIPARAQHWIEAALVFACFLFWFAAHERGIVDSQVHAASAKAVATAQKLIDRLNIDHANEVQANEAKHQKALADTAAAHAADLARLRALDSQHEADAVLGGSSAAAAAQRAEDERRFTSLEQVAAGLADALRTEQDNLNLCYADRDALTGK